MNRVLWFAPFGVMVLFAAWIGFRMGTPRSDTQIITGYAADYVTQTGNSKTHCEARPAPDSHIRMIIDCLAPIGAGYRYVVGTRGGLIARIKVDAPDT